MKEKKIAPVVINLKQLLKPCKDWERVTAWKESLLELERATGISGKTVRGWFSGKNVPSFLNVKAIADYKKVNVYDLYVDKSRWVKIFHVSPGRQEIMKKIAEMPDDQFFNTINFDVLKNITETETENREGKKEEE